MLINKERVLGYKDQLDLMVNQLNQFGLSPSLVWLYVWDIVRDYHDNNPNGAPYDEYQELVFISSLDDVFLDIYENTGNYGFTLEYGAEHIHEHVRDWLMERGHMAEIEDQPDWLEEKAEGQEQ